MANAVNPFRYLQWPKLIGAIIESMHSRGQQLHLVAGRIISGRPYGCGSLEIKVGRRRSQAATTVTANRLINCTGSESDAGRFPVPLLKQIVADGLAQLR
jgi:uncharacterized NAD(P)/FAD-binding protein YdhS